ncbi:MAG: YvcK family protein [Candidatus Sungiibacteriota bacterium]|uniref:Putative gluconeogenesis factor n=1 Tax=Candidatus Sungiibacteriota bacterium TaxID=2750080 RepID=A0A7T5UR00_9BACT|nr:MAG: YvcK family protein [Candidatus Sungbacteria bacterium]
MLTKPIIKIPKVVVIGGGTGVFTVLSGLRKYNLDLTAIVSMADDGGSSGTLREEFGILPPGDARRALVALAHTDNQMLSELFNYRFTEGRLTGHAFGNLLLTALERITGSFEGALSEAGRILNVRGRVIPVTLDKVRLCAKLEDGTVVRGETNIDIPKHDPRLRVKKIYLEPRAKGNKNAVRVLKEADLIVMGPGDLFTSVLPNLLVRGVPVAIRKSKAKKVFVVNTMTKVGETNSFKVNDFLFEVEKYLGRGVLNYIVVNTKKPPHTRLVEYEREGKIMVGTGSLSSKPIPILGNFIRTSGFVRHDPEKLSKVLVSLL